jgi:hypothetical protein
MPEGSTLLLFTDGLFERRGVPLDEGRAQVRAILSRSAQLPLNQLCDRLLAEMLGDDVEDDVASIAKAIRKPTVVITPVQVRVRSKASGIIVSAIMVRIAPAATAVMTAIDLRRRAAEGDVAEQRGQAAGHGDAAPDAEDVAGRAARCASCRPRWTGPRARWR